MNTIDIDVGGTFTDMVLTLDGETSYRKVPTTPYDLSVGFMQVVEEAASEAGVSLDDLVGRVETVRYSTTVAMNRLLERSGPRVALITTEGHEDATLIGKGAQWIDGTRLDERRALPHQHKPRPVVPRELIVGVKERVDARGEVVRPLDEEHVREQIRPLVDRGARAFVVSLLWSFVNPAHEKAVKRIIREEYRDYHVGYLPVILSSEVVSRLGEYGAVQHRDPRRLPAALDADRAERHVGQAARARLPRPVLHDPQHGRLRRPVQDDRVAHLQRRADRRADRRARHRPAVGRAQRRHRGRRRHVVRHRPGGRRLRPQLRVQPDHRPVDGLHDHAAVALDRRGRRVDRVDQPRAGRPARGRAAERRLLPGPGRLPARRDRADGHRRQPRARLPEPGPVLRRAHGARPRGRRGRDPRARSPSRWGSRSSRRRR